MARPAVAAEDRLTGHLRSRCTAAEEALTDARAAANGLSHSEYVRQATLKGKIVVRHNRAPDFATAAELRRIGNNLNQLVASYHISGEREPAAVADVCAKLERLLDLILAAE